MNNKCIGAQKFEYNGFYISVDRSTQKIAIHLHEHQSVFIIQRAK